jgi:hypothetical protein
VANALITQPKFADQITASPTPVGTSNTPIQRGYMIWDQPQTSLYGTSGGPLGDGRATVGFLFNPSTVSSDYNIGNASLQAAMMYPVPGDSGNLLSPLQYQTVSWQLYFDRTFELLYGGDPTSVNDPGVIGVQADVLAFMQFTGVLASLSNSEATTILGGVGASGAGAPTTTGGIMMMIPSYVYFGNASQQYASSPGSSANNNAVGQQLAYYGFVSEWTPTYTHWTANMVPIRCSIDVTFTMLPNPPAGTGTATWNDVQKLNGSYVAAVPYAANVTPPSTVYNR